MIKTGRLIPRPWVEADLPVLAAPVPAHSLAPVLAPVLAPALMQHFGQPALCDDTVERLERMQRFDREHGFSARTVVHKADGAVIGNCGLKPLVIPSPEPCDIETGWLIRRDCWGQGYAVKAATATLAPGLVLAPRVNAIAARTDIASQQVMAKLGMTHDAGLDFDHPDVAEGLAQRPHLTFAMAR